MEEQVIYLAGGCFWGMEKLMRAIPGVTDAVSGYANGTGEADANYPAVCTGRTGFRETVRVTYDPARVSTDALLFAFFAVIDPTLKDRQGADFGSQYQAGIYYADAETGEAVKRVAAVERRRYDPFSVEIGPLKNFFPAEEYHQRYLEKHPTGYCHVNPGRIRALAGAAVDPGAYPRPDEAALRARLTPEEYAVTQQAATEPPFHNAFWDRDEPGIYVDAATGEPLFSSKDKFRSSCGWPAFQAPIEAPVVVEREDRSHGMIRTEVRSRAGDSHLGHVFDDDPESPGGRRYCINSAALRFVPRDKMAEAGYGRLLPLLY